MRILKNNFFNLEITKIRESQEIIMLPMCQEFNVFNRLL